MPPDNVAPRWSFESSDAATTCAVAIAEAHYRYETTTVAQRTTASTPSLDPNERSTPSGLTTIPPSAIRREDALPLDHALPLCLFSYYPPKLALRCPVFPSDSRRPSGQPRTFAASALRVSPRYVAKASRTLAKVLAHRREIHPRRHSTMRTTSNRASGGLRSTIWNKSASRSGNW
jgi:hypothetical protein